MLTDRKNNLSAPQTTKPALSSKPLHTKKQAKACATLLMLSLLLLCGLIVGVMLVLYASEMQTLFLDRMIGSRLRAVESSSFFALMGATLSLDLSSLLLLYLLGLWAVSPPLTLGAVMLHGMGIGVTGSYAIAFFGWKGVFFYLLLVFPFVFLLSCILLLGAKDSLRMSLGLFAVITHGEDKPSKEPSRLLAGYNMRFLCLLTGAAGIGLLHALALFLCGHFFSFS